MHDLFKELLLFIFFELFICLPTQCPHGQGEGAVKQRLNRYGQREGGR